MGVGAAAVNPALLSPVCCFLLQDRVLLSQTVSLSCLKKKNVACIL